MTSPLPPVRDQVLALRENLIEMRRDFHQHPELSWKEERTQRVILERLHSLGLDDVRPIATTGATGLIPGAGQGPTVLWRADIDALPIPEKSGLPFASANEGATHACGHDAHMAIALGLAEALAARRQDLAGSVRFVFQPAEEAAGGAPACIEAGVLEDPHVDRVLGLHVAADVPIGAVNVAPGPFFAAPTAIRITITGRGGHAASPHQAVDSVVVAAHVITALQTVVSRSVAPAEAAVLTIGKIEAGFRGNIIAESATMTGTIRSYTDTVREQLLARTEEILAGVCAAFGAEYRFQHNTSCPPLVNDPEVTNYVIGQAREYFGPGNIFGMPSMGADDMACFLQERPGCYFWLGARNEAKGIAGRHHDPGFVIDEDALPLGVEFGLRLIEGSLAGP
ncbi:MAG: M20 family metallopeptidase [Dehalococcoidia bacterium]